MMNYGSFFSGGGFADIGAKMAGYDLVFANEIEPEIAEVYRRNLGDHIIVGNVLDVDISRLPSVDLFHASPVCTRASLANHNRGEAEIDILTARKTAEYIETKLPRCVTLENVIQYREFEAYRLLIETLDRCGYWHKAENVNAADFGVPQTRRRLIVRAVRGGYVPYLPKPVRWVGWYEAIADLIDTLPDDDFAAWQIARLPEEMKTLLIVGGGNTNLQEAEPGRGCRYADEPSATVTTGENGGYTPRAFISRPYMANPETERGTGFYYADRPAPTVITDNRHQKAFVISGGQAQHYKSRSTDGSTTKATIRSQEKPIFTIIADMQRQPYRAAINGRVVRMTPRALARFQSVPDWYELPLKDKLAGKIIGNGVPSLMYQRIAEGMKEVTRE